MRLNNRYGDIYEFEGYFWILMCKKEFDNYIIYIKIYIYWNDFLWKDVALDL